MTNEMNEMSANYAFAQDNGTVVMVGFADQDYQTRDCLLLQRTLKPSKGDFARGWDDIHIMVNEESRSTYGGVEGVELWSDYAIIKLAPATASKVQVGTPFRVNLSAQVANLGEVGSMLEVLCGSYAKVALHV